MRLFLPGKVAAHRIGCGMLLLFATAVTSANLLRADDEKQSGRALQNRAGWRVFNPGLEQGVQALAKGFCIDLRDHYSKEPLHGRVADLLRHYLDPEYLKKHDLEEGDLPILTTPFRRLDDFRVSDDLESVLCTVDNDAGRKEVILLRIVIDRGEKYSYIYFRPGRPPDSKSGFFAPWVLKIEISTEPARLALPVPE
jgi:hypothetical protein